jgi:DNA polymerase-3 subunit delta
MTSAAKPPRITLATGPEAVLLDRAVANAISAIRKVNKEADKHEVDLKPDESGPELVNATEPTLFGDDAIVVVRGIESASDSGADALLRLLAQPPEHVWWVLVHAGGVGGKKLLDAAKKAGAEVVECKAIKKGKATMDVLTAEFARHKRRITSDALAAYYSAVGHNIPMLIAGINQLVQDVENDPIQMEDIRNYFGGVADVAGYEIANAVWDRKSINALESLRFSLNNNGASGTGVMTVMAMANGLRAIVGFGSMPPGTSEGDVARELSIPPWQVKDLRSRWQRWSGDQRKLAKAVVELADAEAAMKGGLGGRALDEDQKMYEIEMLLTRLGARSA